MPRRRAHWLPGFFRQQRGIFFVPLRRRRWDKSYSAVRLSEIPHRRLTKPKRVTEVFFDGSDADAPPLKAALKLEVTESGLLNAVRPGPGAGGRHLLAACSIPCCVAGPCFVLLPLGYGLCGCCGRQELLSLMRRRWG